MLARSAGLATLALICLALVGAKCTPVFNLVAPDDGALLDEDPVAVVVMLAKAFDSTSVAVRVDGVDLIAELGLVPPFVNESGVVLVGGDPITVTGFSYDTTLPQVVPLLVSLQGLPLGAHAIEIEATRNNNQGQPVVLTRLADFDLVAGFSHPAVEIGSGGLGPAPQSFGSEGTLVGASLGAPLAGPPISYSDGSELRPGFVPVAEALIE